MDLFEDNQACLQTILTGKNPTMRHITITHGVNTAWLHERVDQGTLRAVYIKSDEQAADMFTKAFGSVPTFERVRALIQIASPTSKLNESVILPCPSVPGGSCGHADLPSNYLQDLARIRPECNTHGFADYRVRRIIAGRAAFKTLKTHHVFLALPILHHVVRAYKTARLGFMALFFWGCRGVFPWPDDPLA